MKKTTIWALVIIAIIGGALGVWWKIKAAPTGPNLDAFAQCLSDKKVIMYGAYWCSHCQNQKKLFGSSFAYVPYVECTQDVKKCEEQKVTGYPTWVFADGGRFEGEISLEDLASKTGCTLPGK